MKYVPYILIVVAFFLGFFIRPKPDPEVERLFREKQIILQQQIDLRNAKIQTLTKAGQAIREKAIQDSIRFSERLQASQTRINAITKRLNEIKPLDNATTDQLDSLRAALYGTNPLHSN